MQLTYLHSVLSARYSQNHALKERLMPSKMSSILLKPVIRQEFSNCIVVTAQILLLVGLTF